MKLAELDTDPLVRDLNPPQREAVLANDGPLLLLAGAGSGKTRVITHKIAWLIQREGVRPWQILAVTFTNKAAGEMRERCARLLGADAGNLWLGTFHSIGVRVLRQHGGLLGLPPSFVIYDSDDQAKMIGRSMAALNISDKAFPLKKVQHYINQAKQDCQGPDDPNVPRGSFTDRKHHQIYEHYEREMRAAGAVDFGDLIYLPLRLMREFPMVASEFKQRWQYILVDEFQDTNHAQYALLRAVLNDRRRICVVGDDDQSIYRWRGAEIENILGFDKDFPDAKVIRLERNYRSSGNILEVSGALIAQNTTRHGKTLWTERDAGDPVKLYEAEDDRAEAEWVARQIQGLRGRYRLREVAIFYRTNAQSRSFEDAFRMHGLPHAVVGGLKFYDRMEVKDILAYLKVVANPRDVVSLERIVNTPTRGIGKGTLEIVATLAEQERLTFWAALQRLAESGRQAVQKKLKPFVELMEGLQEMARTQSALAVAQAVIERTRYIERLEAERTLEAEGRVENVKELLNAIAEYGEITGEASLAAFLDQVALVSDIDRADTEQDAVLMMTAHTAKGLEFDVVFVTGIEEGLLPHFNSADRDGVEEERRLLYVAMTRARHVLHLSHAFRRRRFGTFQDASPSRFLDGLPAHCLEPASALARARASARTPVSGGGLGFGGGLGGYGGPQAPARRAPAQPAWDEFNQAMPAYDEFSQAPPSGGAVGPGSAVFHPQFGQGRVVDVSGSGDKAIARVRFATGERKIMARFLTTA